MALSIGILGLPNVGKSTLFRALTKKQVDISNYPFCTIEPNIGIVEVPDERLEELARIQQPRKVVRAIIKFVDVAGLVKGAHRGEGLGNQFLAHLRECDALLHIVRCFKAENIVHVESKIDPERDIETVKSEIVLKDLETIEARIEKIGKDVKQGKKESLKEFETLKTLKEELKKGETAQGIEGVEHLFLLSGKPMINLFNCSENEFRESGLEGESNGNFQLDLREELDKSELNEEERKELELTESRIDDLIKKCYKVLNLITFFTVAGKEEARAWPIRKGSAVFEGAGKIHSDFQKKFIAAEVLNWRAVVEAGSWKKAREFGLLKKVGKDYILKDGDVVEVKHN